MPKCFNYTSLMHSVPSTQSKLRQVLGLHKTSEKKLTRLKWLVEKVYKRKNLEITVQRFIKLLNRIGLIWLLIGMLSVESCVYTLRSNFSHSNSFISPPPDSFYYVLMWIVIHGYNKGKSCKCKWKRKKKKKNVDSAANVLLTLWSEYMSLYDSDLVPHSCLYFHYFFF